MKPSRSSSTNHDHVDGITVDQIKRLMLCFAKRPPKSFFSKYEGIDTQKSFAISRIKGKDGKITTRKILLHGESPPQQKKKKEKIPGTEKLSDDEDENDEAEFVESSGDDNDDNNSGSDSDKNKNTKEKRKRSIRADNKKGKNNNNKSDDDSDDEDANAFDLLEDESTLLNVKLKPLNRAVFIERVHQVLPDRPDSVINTWFNQLDTDGLGLVTWSSFSAFLLFRSTSVGDTDSKLAEFHINTDAPEDMPPLLLRHSAPATCMLWNPKSNELLTGGPDGNLLAWDPQTLEPRGAILTVKSFITGLAHLDNGNRIAISAMDRSVTILDSRTMRVIRCFAGRSIPKYFEAKEVTKIIEFFEKRPDWIKIERGPRILTAPPELPTMMIPPEILNSNKNNNNNKRSDSPPNNNNSSNSSNSNRRAGSPSTLHGGRSIVAGSGAHQRHSDRPWAAPPAHSGSHHGAGGGLHGDSHHHNSSSSSSNPAGSVLDDEISSVGTYLVGEAALARTDAGRRTEVHVLLDLDRAPTAMCSYNVSALTDDGKGRVSSGIQGAAIESHASLQTDPVILGLPDGVVKQYNLPTMFPRAVTPKSTWKPHSDRVQMLRYVPELKGVLSCSDDGTFVLSHPERRIKSTLTGELTSIMKNYRIPASGTMLSMNNNNNNSSMSLAAMNAGFAAPNRLSMAQSMRMSLGQQGGHTPAVLSFDYSADLKLLATCAYDRHAYLYDPTQETHVAKLQGLAAPAVSVTFNGQDNQVVVTSTDRSVRIYDTRHSDMPLQVLERPAFSQFGNFSSNCLMVLDRKIFTAGCFPSSYCSRVQYSESVQKNAPPTGNKLSGGGGSGGPGDNNKKTGKKKNLDQSELSELKKKSTAARAAYFDRMAKKNKKTKGAQPFHSTSVFSVFIDELGVSSGITRMFTLCQTQMMSWSLLRGDNLFSLGLSSTSTGRSQNTATCSCASEGCLKVVVGYDDGSVVLWIPAVGEAAARLPEHETIHSRVRCVGICYRRSFAVKQMIILASIENQVLFLAQGETYTLSVKASWQCPAEFGYVTCIHEITNTSTPNTVLCGTNAGALVILSLTTNEQEGHPLIPEMKVPVVVTVQNNNNNNNNNEEEENLAQSTKTIYEQNEFGRVESLVHTPSFGANVFAAIHTHGDVIFWDCVHRIQVGAICIRGMQSQIIQTFIRDFGTFQLIAYADEQGNTYLRRLDFTVTGMQIGGGLLSSSSSDHHNNNNSSASQSHGEASSIGNFSFGSGSGGAGDDDTGRHQVKREQLDPYLALNLNNCPNSTALVLPGGSHQTLGSVASAAPASNIVAMYRSPYEGFRSLTEAEKRIKEKEEQAERDKFQIGGAGRRKSVAGGNALSLELEDPNEDDENNNNSSSKTENSNKIDPNNKRSRRMSRSDNMFSSSLHHHKNNNSAGSGPRSNTIFHANSSTLPPEYVNVVLSNVTVPEVRTYCFEINEGLVALVGTGGTKEWLDAPNIDEMASCVDSEEWKLMLESSISMGMLNSPPTGRDLAMFQNNNNQSDTDGSPPSLNLTGNNNNNYNQTPSPVGGVKTNNNNNDDLTIQLPTLIVPTPEKKKNTDEIITSSNNKNKSSDPAPLASFGPLNTDALTEEQQRQQQPCSNLVTPARGLKINTTGNHQSSENEENNNNNKPDRHHHNSSSKVSFDQSVKDEGMKRATSTSSSSHSSPNHQRKMLEKRKSDAEKLEDIVSESTTFQRRQDREKELLMAQNDKDKDSKNTNNKASTNNKQVLLKTESTAAATSSTRIIPHPPTSTMPTTPNNNNNNNKPATSQSARRPPTTTTLDSLLLSQNQTTTTATRISSSSSKSARKSKSKNNIPSFATGKKLLECLGVIGVASPISTATMENTTARNDENGSSCGVKGDDFLEELMEANFDGDVRNHNPDHTLVVHHASEGANTIQTEERPLSLTIPHGHNERIKRQERLNSMVRPGALEEMKNNRQKNFLKWSENDDDEDEAAMMMMNTFGGIHMNANGSSPMMSKGWKAVKNTTAAVSHLMTPRTPALMNFSFSSSTASAMASPNLNNGSLTPSSFAGRHSSQKNINNSNSSQQQNYHHQRGGLLSAGNIDSSNSSSVGGSTTPMSGAKRNFVNGVLRARQGGGGSALAMSINQKRSAAASRALTPMSTSNLQQQQQQQNDNNSNTNYNNNNNNNLLPQDNFSLNATTPSRAAAATSRNLSSSSSNNNNNNDNSDANTVLSNLSIPVLEVSQNTGTGTESTNETPLRQAYSTNFSSGLPSMVPSRKVSTVSNISMSSEFTMNNNNNENNQGTNDNTPTKKDGDDNHNNHHHNNNKMEGISLTSPLSADIPHHHHQDNRDDHENNNHESFKLNQTNVSVFDVTVTQPFEADSSMVMGFNKKPTAIDDAHNNNNNLNGSTATNPFLEEEDSNNNNKTVVKKATLLTPEEEEEQKEKEEELKKKQQMQNDYALEFSKASNEDEVAHRQLDLMKNRFKNYSSEVQEQVEKNVRKNREAFVEHQSTGGKQQRKGAAGSGGGDASDLIIFSGNSKKRMQPEELDGYPDADVLLEVLRAKEPLSMNRAMGVNGKLSIFGVLQPSSELQAKWKEKREKADAAGKLMAQQHHDGDEMIIPSRNEAGAAFAFGNQGQLTQMRGRRHSTAQEAIMSQMDSTDGASTVEKEGGGNNNKPVEAVTTVSEEQ